MKRSNVVGFLLMIALLYPLSFGPAVRLLSDHITEASAWRMMAIYDPLVSLPILGGVLRWYATLFARAPLPNPSS